MGSGRYLVAIINLELVEVNMREKVLVEKLTSAKGKIHYMEQELRLQKLSSVPVNSLAQVRVDQGSLGVSLSGTIASLGCTARLFGVISKAHGLRCVSCGGHVHTGLFHHSGSGGGGAVVSALVAYTWDGSISLIAGCICAG